MRTIGAHEARTQLPRLLDEVAAGGSITITRRGLPVAFLVPPRTPLASRTAAAAALIAFRREHHLNGVRIRDLIYPGRTG